MKKVLLCLVMLLMCGCLEESRITAWSLVGSDVQNENTPGAVRIGASTPDGLEFGAVIEYPNNFENENVYGAYIVQELTPDSNGVIPYLGGTISTAESGLDGGYYGPVIGTLIPLRANIQTVIEYKWQQGAGDIDIPSNQENVFYAGLRIKTR